MSHTRAELESQLAALGRSVLKLLAEHEDPENFWPAFAGEADVIADGAAPGDFDWVQQQIDEILRRHGLSPSDDSP